MWIDVCTEARPLWMWLASWVVRFRARQWWAHLRGERGWAVWEVWVGGL